MFLNNLLPIIEKNKQREIGYKIDRRIQIHLKMIIENKTPLPKRWIRSNVSRQKMMQ